MTNFILKRIQEKPRLGISDVIVSLQRKEDKLSASVSFNVDNTGDRGTTIIRTIVTLGPDVEVIEELKSVSAHSSIRVPEKSLSTISFSFPKDVQFLNGTRRQYFENQEKLKIRIMHTHGETGKTYDLPPSSEWERQAVFKGGPTVLILG